MKKILNYINRDKSVIKSENNLEHLFTFKNFPVFMGCTNDSVSDDLFADMIWKIDPDSGLIQLSKLIPMDILYMDQHMDATGATWSRYNDELAKFINDNKFGNILEIGGGSGKLAKRIINLDDGVEYTVIEPNPTFKETKRLKIINAFFDDNFILNDSSIKTITLSQVLEHVYYPEDFLNKVRNSLPIGGRFIVGYPNLDFLFSNKFTNAINFEHTMLMTEYYVDYFLSKTGFKLLKKVNYENHSHFYSVEKVEKKLLNFKFENKYSKYKKMFIDFISHHESMVKEINLKISDSDSQIYLFGAHIFSQYLFAFGLNSNNITSILDNSPLKIGKRLYGSNLCVESPKVLKNIKNPLVILKAGLYNEEIKNDIINNINPNVIFI